VKSRQLDFEAIPDGTNLNSGRAAQQGMTIYRFCYDVRHPANREVSLVGVGRQDVWSPLAQHETIAARVRHAGRVRG
jgi:hypothetical protein